MRRRTVLKGLALAPVIGLKPAPAKQTDAAELTYTDSANTTNLTPLFDGKTKTGGVTYQG